MEASCEATIGVTSLTWTLLRSGWASYIHYIIELMDVITELHPSRNGGILLLSCLCQMFSKHVICPGVNKEINMILGISSAWTAHMMYSGIF